MKILVKFTSSLTPVVDYDKEAAKAMRGVVAWLENPRVIGDYTLAGTRHSISIWEGESIEQLHMDIMALPSHRLGEWELVPLIDNREQGWIEKLTDTNEMNRYLDQNPLAQEVRKERASRAGVRTTSTQTMDDSLQMEDESFQVVALAVSNLSCSAA